MIKSIQKCGFHGINLEGCVSAESCKFVAVDPAGKENSGYVNRKKVIGRR